MGCDIHLQVERREGDVWKRVPHPERECMATYCDDGVYSDETPNEAIRGETCPSCKGTNRCIEAFYDDRNYDVFGILADVRNGYGFAGVDTGDGFVPIDSPRGLPDDLSDEIRLVHEGEMSWCSKCEAFRPTGTTGTIRWTDREGVERSYEDEVCPTCGAELGYGKDYNRTQHFWMGDHSHSWLLVSELLAYDWDRTTKRRGWVDAWQFEVCRTEGKPTSWSGGISGASIEHTGSMGAALAEPAVRHYTNVVEWEVTYRDVAERFLTVLHRDIVPLGPPEDVRLVFGFDS